MNKVKSSAAFFRDIFTNRRMLFGLARNDFKAKFASSFLGMVWAFVQPLVTILVFWFVFQVGFKNPPVNQVPFIIWLTPSYLAWAFFSEALMGGTNCLMEYSYLVKKINFRVSMIPLVKIISSAFIHMAFILFLFFMTVVSGVSITIYCVQIIYYFACTFILLIGLCWLLAAVAPFVKDTTSIVGVFIQIGFWITPIFWDPETMSPFVQNILRLNPMFYICRGYRDCFVDKIWFWNRGFDNLFFWGITLLLLFAGAHMFRKLRPLFADVL